MSTERAAFLSTLTVGSVVHLVLTDDRREDAVVTAITPTGRITILTGDFREYKLDSYGYTPKSLVSRIEPANGTPAAEWNADYAARAEAARLARVARIAAMSANNAHYPA